MLSNVSAYNGEPRPIIMIEGNTVGSLTEGNSRDDPVTTEAVKAEAAVPAGFFRQLYGCCNTPTPRPYPGQGEEIVYAISNDGDACDVGSSHPGAVVGPKGWAVRPLKRYVSWVQNVGDCVLREQSRSALRLISVKSSHRLPNS